MLDIETIPDFSVWTQGEGQWRLVPGDQALSRFLGTIKGGKVGSPATQAAVEKVEPFPLPMPAGWWPSRPWTSSWISRGRPGTDSILR